MPTNKVGGPIHHSILDSIITGIFGANTDEMTPEEGAKVENERKAAQQEAFAMADSARKNPGAAFMNGPDLSKGGTDLLKSIGDIVKFFSAGSGG